MSTKLPIDELMRALQQNTLVKIFAEFEKSYPEALLKDLTVDEIGAGRDIVVMGKRVTNFGSDSFLGLDQDPRVIQAIHRGLDRWGSHNGTSRSFCQRAIQSRSRGKTGGLARGGVDLDLSLRHAGQPRGHTGARRSQGCHRDGRTGAQLDPGGSQAGPCRRYAGRDLRHDGPEDLEQTLQKVKPYRLALICIDGVYSMSGAIPPHESVQRNCNLQ